MLKLYVILVIFSLHNVAYGYLAQLAARLLVPGTPAPPGSPWPKTQSLLQNPNFATISGREINYKSNVDCPILSRAFQRYDADFLFRDLEVKPAVNTPVLSQVIVNIPASEGQNLCNEYPRLYTEPDKNYERYTINISLINELDASVTIAAWTVWGALQGIETFSQLIWKDAKEPHFYVNFTEISDVPRFPHRGFMLDTARHYVDLPVIQSVLDGMAYNKLNVFHWHLVDDQSFPFVSRRYPELSMKGAYLPELTYEPEEVQGIIDYARDRGIRVLLEFDTPGHTLGFGKAFPDILTPCYGEGPESPGTPDYPNHAAYEILDPTRNITYEVMKEFFTEIKNVSEDVFVHLGMDEVYHACWNSSPVVNQFMADNNMKDFNELEEYYAVKHIDMVKGLGFKPIIWHDSLSYSLNIPKDVVIQVWKGSNSNGTPSDAWIPYLEEALGRGYNSILSSCWYLNYVSYPGAWSNEYRKYYECDPIVQLPNITEDEKKLILGGEAAYWGEYADTTNFLPRIFPLVGTTAERLWSPEFDISNSTTDDAWHRLDQHRCRMLWRGIPAQPLYNSYCFAQEKTGMRKPPKKNSAIGDRANTTFLMLCITLLTAFTTKTIHN